MAESYHDNLEYSQNTKRCYNCHTHLPLHVKKCTYCGAKVLEVNEHGIAGKPFEWKNYAMSIISILALAAFIWWAFFRDK